MDVPLWVSGVGLAVLLPLTVEVGYRLHVRIARRGRHPPERDGHEWTMIVAAALTLLALLISFTVSMAVDRYEHSRQVAKSEANAVSPTYLRAGLFAPPASDRLSALTARYARDRRVTLAGAGPKGRVPARILLMLGAYAAATAAVLAYALGARRRRHLVGSALLFLVMAMTDLLPLDVDRPGSGGVPASQTPMDRLNAAIAQWEVLRRHAPHSGSDHKEDS